MPIEVAERKFRLRFTLRAGDDGRLVAEGENVLVGYNHERGESAPLAEALLEGLRRAADGAG